MSASLWRAVQRTAREPQRTVTWKYKKNQKNKIPNSPQKKLMFLHFRFPRERERRKQNAVVGFNFKALATFSLSHLLFRDWEGRETPDDESVITASSKLSQQQQHVPAGVYLEPTSLSQQVFSLYTYIWDKSSSPGAGNLLKWSCCYFVSWQRMKIRKILNKLVFYYCKKKKTNSLMKYDGTNAMK